MQHPYSPILTIIRDSSKAEVKETSRSDAIGIYKMSVKVTTMVQKSGGYIHTQTASDFQLNLDVLARKDTFQKIICYIAKKL